MQIRHLIWAGALIGSGGAAQTPPLPSVASRPPACATAEHRQFDYWVGYWDVYRTGTETLVARSLIERRYNGCAIRENWMPLNGQQGGSFSVWHPPARQWRQLWVDSSNGWVEFTGGLVDGAIELTGPWAGSGPNGENGIVRMRYTREAGGTVRQHGQVSIDNGRTWAPSFDFTYRPSANPAPPSPGT